MIAESKKRCKIKQNSELSLTESRIRAKVMNDLE